jgi:uncharacterized protein
MSDPKDTAAATHRSPGGTCEIELLGERLLLHPERALIWPSRKTLIVADPHFGKDDVFRRAGIALPRGPAIADLQRLTALLEGYGCERLAVLGDFVHAATQDGDSFLHAFALWRRAHSVLSVDVIAGNHDRREKKEKWNTAVRWHSTPLIEKPFVFAHEPEAHDQGYVLAGHIHPVRRMHERNRTLRVPVFWQRADCLVLPSFGSFTGGAVIQPAMGEKLYAAAPERVIALQRP